MIVHLLRELPRQLDGLHIRAEGTPEHAFEKRLDLLFDRPEDHECGRTLPPRDGHGTRSARTTSAAAGAGGARRGPGGRPGAARGTSPSAASGASAGPSAKSNAPRGSRQERATQAAARAAYSTARPSDTFPSGRTGTASATASPSRGRNAVTAPAATANAYAQLLG